MKKFGRQGQYYQDKKQINALENNDLYENQSWNYDYEDPVDLEFLNEFQQKLKDYNFNSRTNSNQKNNKNIYNTPKFSSLNYSNSSSYYRNDNNSSNNERYIRLSELNDNNPYNCLEVSQLSTEEEIRKAYKKLIIINHPDKGGDPEQFNRIHEAYQMLSNPITKKIIDTFGSMSLDLVRNIINNDLIKSNQLKEDINFCIQQNDYPQLYFLLNNIKT